MMKPLYRTRRLAVLNLAERGLLGCRSRPIGVVVTEGRSRRTRVGERRRYKGARQGKGRVGEESRRVSKGVEGDAGCPLPDKSFSLSLASLSRV